HSGVMSTQALTVAVGLPERLGNPDCCIAPYGRGTVPVIGGVDVLLTDIGVLQRIGDHERDILVRMVAGLFGQVEQPLVQEVGDVELEGCAGSVGGDIAGPAEAFIALGAVGGYVQEVALLSPDGVVHQLVHVRLGAFEGAVAGIAGGTPHCWEALGPGSPGQPLNPGFRDAVEGEGGWKELPAPAPEEQS